MIITTRGHFWIAFDNGYTVSVFNDYGSYSDNHSKLVKSLMSGVNAEVSSKNSEVAIAYKDLGLVNPLHWDDTVKGYVTPSELLEILNEVSKL